MVSHTSSTLVFLLAALCGLVSSGVAPRHEEAPQNDEPRSIALSEVLALFRRLHHDSVDIHLAFMLFVSSYGDRLYQLPVDVSADCRRTAAATALLLQRLAVCEEAFHETFGAVDAATQELKKRTELTEHPLEPVCRHIDQRFGGQASLNALLEKAKKQVTVANGSPQPYLDALDESDVITKVVETASRPQLAKLLALMSFYNVLRGSKQSSASTTAFVRASREVAKREKFAESMQAAFEKAIADVVPQITADDRVQKYKSSRRDLDGFWWVPSMTTAFHDYVAKDPTLKKEVEDAGAVKSD